MRTELLFVCIFAASALITAIGFMPLSSEIEGSDLQVRTRLKTFHYDMRRVTKAEKVKQDNFSSLSTLRLCAVGWPFQPHGWVWNRQYGLILAMVNDPTRMVLLRVGGRNLLVSPDNYDSTSMSKRA